MIRRSSRTSATNPYVFAAGLVIGGLLFLTSGSEARGGRIHTDGATSVAGVALLAAGGYLLLWQFLDRILKPPRAPAPAAPRDSCSAPAARSPRALARAPHL